MLRDLNKRCTSFDECCDPVSIIISAFHSILTETSLLCLAIDSRSISKFSVSTSYATFAITGLFVREDADSLLRSACSITTIPLGW